MSTPSIIVWPTRSPVEVGSMCPTWRKLPSSLSILVSHSDPEEHLVPWVWCFCCLISSIMAAFSSSELISISFAPLPLQYLMDSCQVIGFSTKLETNSISHFWTNTQYHANLWTCVIESVDARILPVKRNQRVVEKKVAFRTLRKIHLLGGKYYLTFTFILGAPFFDLKSQMFIGATARLCHQN